MKRNLTKIAALLLAAVMLTGCAGDTPVEGGSEVTADGSSATTTTFAPADITTAATSQDIIEESTALTESDVPTEEPAEATTAATEATTAATEAVITTEAIVTTADTTAATTTSAPTEQEEAPVEVKYAALTFDDGPNTTTTAEVLDVLEKYDVIASFFLIGQNIDDESAKVVRCAYDMGCEINNHSKTHPYMNQMTVEEIIEEFTYTDDKIFEITGERSKFFRPPYIAVSNEMLDNIDVPFVAGIGCNDWMDNNPADRRAMSILRQVKDGDIILLHDAEGNHMTVEALDTIIPEMLAQGYKFVTVTELFNIKGIEISGEDKKIYTNVLQKYQYN